MTLIPVIKPRAGTRAELFAVSFTVYNFIGGKIDTDP